MRALRVASRKGAEISYEEMPAPDPGIGDVLIEVKAASFTPTELEWPSTWVDRAGHDRTPVVLGHEVSGVVRALGYGTTGFDPGDEVFGIADWYRDGAAAEYVAVEARNLAAKPAFLSHVDAAALSLAGLTAWQALFVHGQLESGQTVVVTGASGGVGTIAVQLAADAGTQVVAVARRWAHPLLEELGAHVLVDAENPKAADIEGADLLFDLVGGDLASQCTSMLRDGATVVSAVDASLRPSSGGRSLFFVVEADRAQLGRLAGMVAAARLRPVVGNVSDIRDGTEQGFSAKRSGGIPGKVVLTLS